MPITTTADTVSVLLVEPSEPVRRFLVQNLTADRFAVHAAEDLQDALLQLRRARPELALVALDLPEARGLEIVSRIRAGTGDDPWDPGIPVVGLSRHGDPQSVVRAIDRGADDHLVRPFHYAELLARSTALLRRTRGQTVCDELRVGPLVVDRRARRATLHGQPVVLSAKEFALLDALARDPRRVVTKQELLRDVWGYLAAGRTRTVDSHASRLRRKLAACGGGNRFVANVWGVGYRLLPEGM